MKIKVLILGCTGMLGHVVYSRLAQEPSLSVYGTHLDNRRDALYFDAQDGLKKLARICQANSGIKYIINCVGITANRIDVGKSESIARAVEINSLFPHRLAAFAAERKIRVMQISTDGVFSGQAKRYTESSACDCQDLYGKTKCLGEVSADNFLNIRCSIIGPSPLEKGGLWEWFLSQPEGARISGYANHRWHGVTTLQFAELMARIIKEDCFAVLREESPVFHFAPNRPVTKYQLLQIFKKQFKRKVTIKPVQHPEPVARILVSQYPKFTNITGKNLSLAKAVQVLAELPMVTAQEREKTWRRRS